VVRGIAIMALSAAVHGGAMVAIARLPSPVRLILEVPAIDVAVTVPPSEPVDIEMVEIPAAMLAPPAAAPPAVTAATPSTATSTARTATIRTAIATESAAAAAPEGAAPATEPATATGPGALAMRGLPRSPRAAIAALPSSDSAVISEILNRPPAPEVPESGELAANRDGTYTKRDMTFTAHVDADGHVAKIEDKPNFNYKLHIPKPKKIAKAAGQHLANWAEDPYGVSTGTGQDAAQVNEQDKTDGRTYTILSGGFDVTDAAMRLAGQDPYEARKREFLDRTFDERVQIGTAHRAQQLEAADQIILDHLGKLWARTDLAIAQKRALVFELWDDCAESGGEQLIAGGKKARAALLRWIDVHLPAGGPDAFTEGEIGRFNRRRHSNARFAPYP